jgi:hypothetical protein
MPILWFTQTAGPIVVQNCAHGLPRLPGSYSIHKQFFRQTHCFTYIVHLTSKLNCFSDNFPTGPARLNCQFERAGAGSESYLKSSKYLLPCDLSASETIIKAAALKVLYVAFYRRARIIVFEFRWYWWPKRDFSKCLIICLSLHFQLLSLALRRQ